MEEIRESYPEDVIQLGEIITRYKKLTENNIEGALKLMQDSLQSYYRWSKIRCDIRKGLKRGEKAELKDYLENILKYLFEVHTDSRIIYKNGRDDLRTNKEN